MAWYIVPYERDWEWRNPAHGIPADGDWVFQGDPLPLGGPGAWDSFLPGGTFPSSLVRRRSDGMYFLFYIGSDGARQIDGGPANRRLGVMTSLDDAGNMSSMLIAENVPFDFEAPILTGTLEIS